MRIVSLLPAATEILLALGLEDELVGVTHRCEVPVGIVPPRRVTGEAGLDVAALLDADPDLVLVGDGAAVPSARVARDALEAGDLGADVLTLAPASVEGVFNAISSVGAMTEAEDEAMDVVERLRERLREVEEIVVGRRDRGFRPPRVVALDGLTPPRAVGRWVPDQVRLAGGWELLGVEGGAPAVTTWDAIAEVDPEVLVIMPADLRLDEALETWRDIVLPPGWSDLRAVTERRVFVVDGTSFSRPGPRVVDGIETLAELIDPAAFDGMAPPASWARVD
jgi:iron complex transport system substrate-binding protein